MRGTEFAELSAFVAVAERGSFSKAAGYLGLAPSTLSQTIRALEERLDIRLFNRTTRSVSLTEAGERLLVRVRPAFGELVGAVEAINDLRDKPMGTLRLSVSTIAAQMILAPILKDFLQAYPSVMLDISVDDADGNIVSGNFDAGIRHGRWITHDMLRVKASAESRRIAMASPAYLAAFPMPKKPEDLEKHPCIRFRFGHQEVLPWEFERGKKKVHVQIEGPLIVNDVDLLVKAVRDGVGIGYMVEAYVEEDIRAGRLVPMLTEWSTVYDSFYLYYAGHRHLPAPLKVFIEFLKSRVK